MERPFGAEIELTGIPRQRALHVARLVGFDIRDESYNHATRTWWKIVPDNSVGDGFEVVSPILRGEQGIDDLKTLVTALDDAGGTVNRRCGLHVHVDSQGMALSEMQSIVRRYARYEEQIDAFMPPSRRGNVNTYCRSLRPFVESENFTRARSVHDLVTAQPSRYFKVNLKSHAVHGSLEFRQHSGTLNAMKIHNWLAFLDGFIRESRRLALAGESAIPSRTPPQPPLQPRLAALVHLLSQNPEGQSADTLRRALNLQPHSLRANITYIRRAGVEVESLRRDGETLYRLMGATAAQETPADGGLFSGIAPDVARFYRNRSLVLNASST